MTVTTKFPAGPLSRGCSQQPPAVTAGGSPKGIKHMFLKLTMRFVSLAIIFIAYSLVAELMWFLWCCVLLVLTSLSCLFGILVAFLIKIYTSPKVDFEILATALIDDISFNRTIVIQDRPGVFWNINTR